MKKYLSLFIVLMIVISFQSSAQSGSGNNTVSTSSVCGVYQLGNGPNANSGNGGSRSVLWYDKDLNTIVFIHRAECGIPASVLNTGYFDYDISIDGGLTWLNDQGPIYGNLLNQSGGCSLLGPHRGRFPKGVLFNPPGNTNPANAHVVYAGAWNTAISNFTIWLGQVYGVGHLDGTPSTEHFDSLPPNYFSPEDLFITKQGTVWKVGTVERQDLSMNIYYEDTIGIYKGVWNGNDFDYTYYPVHYTVNPLIWTVSDINIAFGDDGLTGYIAMITNQDSTYITHPDSAYYIQVLKTVDGGITWSCPTDIVFSGAMDSALLVQNNMNRYGAYGDLDIAVDKNNNLHIMNTVIPASSTFGVASYYDYKTFGLFDIYTTDGGNTYQAQLLAHPATIAGTISPTAVNQINESLRPLVSRTWDGSKLFFGWFDTDTLTGTHQNDHPDLRLIGYDVDSNSWTTDLSNLMSIDAGERITDNTSAEGRCFIGNGSYYAIDSSGNYKVPVNFLVSYGASISEIDFRYIDCASPTGTFTHPGHPLPLPTLRASHLCDNGDGVVLSTNDLSDELIVSSNYPNPFTGKTYVNVTLAKAGDVTIEIRNVIGQKLSSSNYKNLKSGLNTITLDASSLTHGLYFFTVTAGNNSVTKKMIVG
jgi:hypothetical protein